MVKTLVLGYLVRSPLGMAQPLVLRKLVRWLGMRPLVLGHLVLGIQSLVLRRLVRRLVQPLALFGLVRLV